MSFSRRQLFFGSAYLLGHHADLILEGVRCRLRLSATATSSFTAFVSVAVRVASTSSVVSHFSALFVQLVCRRRPLSFQTDTLLTSSTVTGRWPSTVPLYTSQRSMSPTDVCNRPSSPSVFFLGHFRIPLPLT